MHDLDRCLRYEASCRPGHSCPSSTTSREVIALDLAASSQHHLRRSTNAATQALRSHAVRARIATWRSGLGPLPGDRTVRLRGWRPFQQLRAVTAREAGGIPGAQLVEATHSAGAST